MNCERNEKLLMTYEFSLILCPSNDPRSRAPAIYLITKPNLPAMPVYHSSSNTAQLSGITHPRQQTRPKSHL